LQGGAAVIRLGVESDAARMMAIYNEAVDDQVHANADVLHDDVAKFSSLYFDGGNRYVTYVAESASGEVIGWGALKKFSARPYDPSMAEVAVYIARGNRSAGLGIHLLRRLMAYSREVGFHSLVAIILEENRQSLRGCKFCGFEEKIRLPGAISLYGGREDVVWLQLVVANSSKPSEVMGNA
jgi:L-amino acid N-acyltransferase